jgi:hypothetical protein
MHTEELEIEFFPKMKAYSCTESRNGTYSSGLKLKCYLSSRRHVDSKLHIVRAAEQMVLRDTT